MGVAVEMVVRNQQNYLRLAWRPAFPNPSAGEEWGAEPGGWMKVAARWWGGPQPTQTAARCIQQLHSPSASSSAPPGCEASSLAGLARDDDRRAAPLRTHCTALER